jgi:hypothetical protein
MVGFSEAFGSHCLNLDIRCIRAEMRAQTSLAVEHSAGEADPL